VLKEKSLKGWGLYIKNTGWEDCRRGGKKGFTLLRIKVFPSKKGGKFFGVVGQHILAWFQAKEGGWYKRKKKRKRELLLKTVGKISKRSNVHPQDSSPDEGG